MVVQTECIQGYGASLSRSYTPVRTSISSLHLDIRNSAEEKGSRQKLSSCRHPFWRSNTCALSMGRQLLEMLSIGMSVRRLERRSSIPNLGLLRSIAVSTPQRSFPGQWLPFLTPLCY